MPQDQEITHRPELVFALVGAAGTRLDDLSRALKDRLTHFNYICDDIHLSSLLDRFPWENQQKPVAACERLKYLQDKGDAFRLHLRDGAALARAAIVAIREKRTSITGNPETPAVAHAYILDQLKHPDEVDLLRQIYGAVLLSSRGSRAARNLYHRACEATRKEGQSAGTRMGLQRECDRHCAARREAG